MNLLNSKFTTIPLAVFLAGSAALAQSTFLNLDFEGANLSPGSGGQVAIGDALPGWTGYLGNTPVTQVLDGVSCRNAPC